MSKLHHFCFYTPLKVFLFGLTISIIITLFLAIFDPFRSEGNILGDEILGLCSIWASFFNSLISYTVCFNLCKIVRNNLGLSFLSFYAPLLIIPLVLNLLSSESIIVPSFCDDLLLWIILSLPFIISQMYYFIKFRKKLRNNRRFLLYK